MTSNPPRDPALVGSTLRILSARWVVPILIALDRGPLRRTALRAQLDGVSDKILTETLRRMEFNGLLTRHTVPRVPIEVDYALTDHARALWPLLSAIERWSAGGAGETER